MQRTYAIGDIHGHIDKLKELHNWIAEDQRRNGEGGVIVHVGDLVDRGPDSAGVVDWLMTGMAAGKPWVVLKGNHDRLMTNYIEDRSKRDFCLRVELTWLDAPLGGLATLESYGIEIKEGGDPDELHQRAVVAVPAAHVRFLEELPVMHQSSGALFVHAGIRPGIPFADQTEDDLVWIRREFHQDQRDHGAIIVHGHTPVDQATHYRNRVNIDTGVAYGGPLSAIVIEDGVVWDLRADHRVALTPD